MFYNVLKLKDLVDLEDGKKLEKNILLEHDGALLVTVALKKDEVLDWHVSDRDACVYVFEGKAEFHFEAEKFEVKDGDVLMFKKDDSHKVLALKDTKFLLVRI